MTAASLTLIIPSHRPALLPFAFASVLNQTVRPHLLVSFQEAGAYSSSWPVRVNALLPAITTTHFALLGDDDKLEPDYVEAVLRCLDDTGADIVDTDVQEFGDEAGVFPGLPWSLATFRHTTPVWFTSAVRTSLARELGGFDPSLEWQDYDFWYRCFKHGASRAHIDRVLWRWRSHGVQQGTGVIDKSFAREQIWRKHPELRTAP
jgi:hypothetical protein